MKKKKKAVNIYKISAARYEEQMAKQYLNEHRHACRMEKLFEKVLEFLLRHKADVELFDVVEYAMLENKQWIDKDLLESL